MRNFEFDLKKIKLDLEDFRKDETINSNVILKDDQILMVFHTNVPLGKVTSEQENQIIQVHQDLKTLIQTENDTDKEKALKSITILIGNINQINQEMINKSNYFWYKKFHND